MSADEARSTAVGSDEMDPVRALRHALYRSAKADPRRRFHALRDKIYRRDVLWRAWVMVRRNNGAPGVDATTLADVEEYGVARLLDELAADLREGRWRPLPARRVFIPKPGSAEMRPLSIPTVRDRIVQAATKIVLESIFEADFLPCSFGFRPKRSAHDALQVLVDEAWRGRRWVVETDIANCFEAIPHDALMAAVAERVSDSAVLKLVRSMLRAGVMHGGQARRAVTGTPQGGVVSPLLANVYLHRVDRVWVVREHGVLVRYADDLVVMCVTREQAEQALARLVEIFTGLGLELKAAKTRIVHLSEGGEGLDFLGFHHRWVRAQGRTGKGRGVRFLARWPSTKALTHARERLRMMTNRRRTRLPVEVVVADMNLFLRGWAGYFRYGHSTQTFSKISWYAFERLARFMGYRHKASARAGKRRVLASPTHYGLVSLAGIVVSPRALKPWRHKAERRR